METSEFVVAVSAQHAEADAAVKKLARAGFNIKQLSVIGKGCHAEEKAAGFYNLGARVKFWGSRGAFWGGMWGFLLDGLFLTIPAVGHVFVVGYLTAAAIAAIKGAVVVGGLSAIGAALLSVGIPKDSVVQYETALEADDVLVMAHGSQAKVLRARMILETMHPMHLNAHGRPATAPLNAVA